MPVGFQPGAIIPAFRKKFEELNTMQKASVQLAGGVPRACFTVMSTQGFDMTLAHNLTPFFYFINVPHVIYHNSADAS